MKEYRPSSKFWTGFYSTGSLPSHLFDKLKFWRFLNFLVFPSFAVSTSKFCDSHMTRPQKILKINVLDRFWFDYWTKCIFSFRYLHASIDFSYNYIFHEILNDSKVFSWIADEQLHSNKSILIAKTCCKLFNFELISGLVTVNGVHVPLLYPLCKWLQTTSTILLLRIAS